MNDITDRRGLLTAVLAAPAAVAVTGTATLVMSGQDPHPEWARRLAVSADTDERAALAVLIATTPAQTAAGAREQVAMALRAFEPGVAGEVERTALENALATLEQLAG